MEKYVFRASIQCKSLEFIKSHCIWRIMNFHSDIRWMPLAPLKIYKKTRMHLIGSINLARLVARNLCVILLHLHSVAISWVYETLEPSGAISYLSNVNAMIKCQRLFPSLFFYISTLDIFLYGLPPEASKPRSESTRNFIVLMRSLPRHDLWWIF